MAGRNLEELQKRYNSSAKARGRGPGGPGGGSGPRFNGYLRVRQRGQGPQSKCCQFV